VILTSRNDHLLCEIGINVKKGVLVGIQYYTLTKRRA